MSELQPPKRGAKCDHCGEPATGLFNQWHGCDECAGWHEETTKRWAQECASANIDKQQE